MRRLVSRTSLGCECLVPLLIESRSRSNPRRPGKLNVTEKCQGFELLSLDSCVFAGFSSHTTEVPPAWLLVRPNLRSRNIEDEVNALADYFSKLTIFLNTSKEDDGTGSC